MFENNVWSTRHNYIYIIYVNIVVPLIRTIREFNGPIPPSVLACWKRTLFAGMTRLCVCGCLWPKQEVMRFAICAVVSCLGTYSKRRVAQPTRGCMCLARVLFHLPVQGRVVDSALLACCRVRFHVLLSPGSAFCFTPPPPPAPFSVPICLTLWQVTMLGVWDLLVKHRPEFG